MHYFLTSVNTLCYIVVFVCTCHYNKLFTYLLTHLLTYNLLNLDAEFFETDVNAKNTTISSEFSFNNCGQNLLGLFFSISAIK